MFSDEYWMRQALWLAEQAKKNNEVPVGAVLVLNDEMVAGSFNSPIALSDPCAHAEILALRQYAEKINNYRLLNTTLYVTLEPCMMCAGALVHARIKRLVYGAYDEKTGAIQSVMQSLNQPFLNHEVAHSGGVLANECGAILSDFFRVQRRGYKSI